MTRARVLALAVLLATVVSAIGAAAVQAGRPRTPPTATFMTRNLFLGVNILRAVGPNTRTVGPQLFREVQATDPVGRMDLVAREISQVRPDLVGLQEVTLWQLGSRRIDYISLLSSALRRRDQSYRVVGAQSEVDVTIPTAEGRARFKLGNAILVRQGVSVRNVRTGVFRSQLTFPYSEGSVRVRRGWDELDATVRGTRFHFVNTHLEAFSTQQRLDQARELIGGPLRRPLPIVLTGDLNSNSNLRNPADRPPFLAVRGAGFVVRQTPLFSCCYNDDLKTGRLDHTVDFIMSKPREPLLATGRTGVTATTRVGTHAADHVGVWSRLRFPS